MAECSSGSCPHAPSCIWLSAIILVVVGTADDDVKKRSRANGWHELTILTVSVPTVLGVHIVMQK